MSVQTFSDKMGQACFAEFDFGFQLSAIQQLTNKSADASYPSTSAKPAISNSLFHESSRLPNSWVSPSQPPASLQADVCLRSRETYSYGEHGKSGLTPAHPYYESGELASVEERLLEAFAQEGILDRMRLQRSTTIYDEGSNNHRGENQTGYKAHDAKRRKVMTQEQVAHPKPDLFGFLDDTSSSGTSSFVDNGVSSAQSIGGFKIGNDLPDDVLQNIEMEHDAMDLPERCSTVINIQSPKRNSLKALKITPWSEDEQNLRQTRVDFPGVCEVRGYPHFVYGKANMTIQDVCDALRTRPSTIVKLHTSWENILSTNDDSIMTCSQIMEQIVRSGEEHMKAFYYSVGMTTSEFAQLCNMKLPLGREELWTGKPCADLYYKLVQSRGEWYKEVATGVRDEDEALTRALPKCRPTALKANPQKWQEVAQELHQKIFDTIPPFSHAYLMQSSPKYIEDVNAKVWLHGGKGRKHSPTTKKRPRELDDTSPPKSRRQRVLGNTKDPSAPGVKIRQGAVWNARTAAREKLKAAPLAVRDAYTRAAIYTYLVEDKEVVPLINQNADYHRDIKIMKDWRNARLTQLALLNSDVGEPKTGVYRPAWVVATRFRDGLLKWAAGNDVNLPGDVKQDGELLASRDGWLPSVVAIWAFQCCPKDETHVRQRITGYINELIGKGR